MYKCNWVLIAFLLQKIILSLTKVIIYYSQQPDKVRIGDLNLKVEENYLEPQIRQIKRIYVHPKYKTTAFYDDIALLELDEEVE